MFGLTPMTVGCKTAAPHGRKSSTCKSPVYGYSLTCRPLDRQLDLLFILDGSGSVSGSTFDTQMSMLNRIVEMVEIGPDRTQIAVMQYSSYTRVEFGFTANPNKEKLRLALQKIRHISGTTRTGKALDKALQVFKHGETSGARVNQEDVAQVLP
uniref:VWFA domain-containing protein n=1 Tax=Ascaris lumbricoides TaxID=6252 RepID=A0A9J2PTV8_ASCLU